MSLTDLNVWPLSTLSCWTWWYSRLHARWCNTFQYMQQGMSWTVQATARSALLGHMTTPHGHAGTLSIDSDINIFQGYTAALCTDSNIRVLWTVKNYMGANTLKTRASGPKAGLWFQQQTKGFLLESIQWLEYQWGAWLSAQRNYSNSLYSFANYQIFKDCLIQVIYSFAQNNPRFNLNTHTTVHIHNTNKYKPTIYVTCTAKTNTFVNHIQFSGSSCLILQ
jgi:hypothetical protein